MAEGVERERSKVVPFNLFFCYASLCEKRERERERERFKKR